MSGSKESHGVEKWRGDIHLGDAKETLKEIPESSVHMAMTSPPYWGLRSYGSEDDIGEIDRLDEFVGRLRDVFRELKRVLRDDGLLFLNIADQYQPPDSKIGTTNVESSMDDKTSESRGEQKRLDAGVPGKCLIQLPEKLSMGLVDDGWVLRNKIVWRKTNPMPEPSAKDRFKQSWEPLYMFSPESHYQFEESMATESDVWEIATSSDTVDHPAPYPRELCRRAIRAGCPDDGIVLDPFAGSGTTCAVAKEMGRDFIGIDLNPDYVAEAQSRAGITVSDPDRLLDDGETCLTAFAEGGGD